MTERLARFRVDLICAAIGGQLACRGGNQGGVTSTSNFPKLPPV